MKKKSEMMERMRRNARGRSETERASGDTDAQPNVLSTNLTANAEDE